MEWNGIYIIDLALIYVLVHTHNERIILSGAFITWENFAEMNGDGDRVNPHSNSMKKTWWTNCNGLNLLAIKIVEECKFNTR